MERFKPLLPLLAVGVFTFAPQGFVYGSSTQQGVPKKEFKIPVEVTTRYFVEKPVEEPPKKLPLEVKVELSASKIGLVYPKEIYIPHEKVKVESSFFSCGQPSDKELYAKAVSAFNKKDFKSAEALFLELLYKYPNSPYALKAKYYLGVIAFLEGNYRKAYRIFKELCQSPYNFEWKKFACYNAVIAGLHIGVHDLKAASSHPFWHHYLLWLEGKEDDYTLSRSLNCSTLEEPYRNYCYYLRSFLNPSSEGVNLPPYYRRSLELRKALLELLGGRRIDPAKVRAFISDPRYGTDFEYFYTYYLISWGDYKRAIRYLADLARRDPKRAVKLAELLVARAPQLGPQVLSVVNAPEVWEVYLTALYNLGKDRYVLKYAPSLGLYRLAGYAAYRLGDYERAALYLKRVKNKNRTDERLLLDALLRTHRWEELLSILKGVKNRYPDLYREYLGWYYYYRGDWAKAAALLKSPLYRAVAYFNLGAYQKALALVENLSTPEAKLLKAKALLALGRFKEAASTAASLHSPEGYYIAGLAYFASGDYKRAAYYFKRVVRYSDKYPQALLRLADSYYNLGYYDAAKRYYLLYIKRYPRGKDIADAYIGLINVYLVTGDSSIADYVYRAVEKYPDLVPEGVKLKLAQAFIRNGEIAKAKKLLEELIKSSDPYVRGEAYLLMAKVEPDRAEEYLKKALQMGSPEIRSRAVVALIEYYLRKGEKEKAKLLLDKYEKDITDMGTLIELYTRLGEFKRLYYLLQELIAADNSYTKKAFEIAERYHRPEFYELALYSLDPKIAAKAAYELEQLALKRGDLKRALKYALLLKVRKLKYEPIYSRALFEVAVKLYDEGYKTDACRLVEEVNPDYLPSAAERLKLETIKANCD